MRVVEGVVCVRRRVGLEEPRRRGINLVRFPF